MKLRLWHVLFLMLLVCVACSIGVHIARKNRNLREQLGRTTYLCVEDLDVGRFAVALKKEYDIDVVVDDRFTRKSLEDGEIDGVSLENSLRIILAKADLSFAINYTGLTIVELDDLRPGHWRITPVYSQSDLP